MRRFGVWIHSGPSPRVEAWGELCISTVPDLQARVQRVVREWPGEPFVLDLRRVWFCDLAGLRSLWWVREQGREAGAEVEVRESAATGRVARLADRVRVARIA